MGFFFGGEEGFGEDMVVGEILFGLSGVGVEEGFEGGVFGGGGVGFGDGEDDGGGFAEVGAFGLAFLFSEEYLILHELYLYDLFDRLNSIGDIILILF